ncbi:MAG: 3-deoxy-D-manno-octulosonic acid transferase [Chitinophagaceae bacterium]
MGVTFYNIFLLFLRAGMRIAALFNKKARQWVEGRRQIFSRLQVATAGKKKIIWMHCASLGEFEQGRPVLEKLKQDYPGHHLLVTFFSPSGYEIMKNYAGADWIFYMPVDGPGNARRFLDIVNPSLVIFVKYEYWYYYLKATKARQVPLLMVSAIFRPNSSFFKWYGGLYRKMLSRFTHLFVQNQESVDLLSRILPADRYSIAGDTRFDRVIDIAEKGGPIPLIEQFTGTTPTIIAGSTWQPDEAILQKTLNVLNNLKLIIAPHEIHGDHITQLQQLFPGCLLYSQLSAGSRTVGESNVLIIDNIGLLSRIYRYAHTTYIGGAFGAGLHNTLEAAVYGKPVLFGPEYSKYMEAVGLIGAGAGFSISNEAGCIATVKQLTGDKALYDSACQAALSFCYKHKGATGKIMSFIQEKRLLTN